MIFFLRRLVVSIALIAFPAFAEYSPLFDQDDIIEMKLRGDLSSFKDLKDRQKKRSEDFSPVAGTLTYSTGNKPFKRTVQIAPRGNNRFMNCPLLPPLMIDFREGAGEAPLFDGLDAMKVKLTTPCFSTERLNTPRHPTLKKEIRTDYVLREYAIYKILESFGIPAFKTRLVKMTYEDKNGQPLFFAYSFFIEPAKFLERRYNAHYLNFKKIPTQRRRELQRYQPQQYAEILLQEAIYLERTDHSWFDHRETSMNNRGFLFSNETNQLISVLCYDFDWSFLVGSPLLFSEPPSPEEISSIMNLETHYLRTTLQSSEGSAEERKANANFAQRTFSQKQKVLSALSKIPLNDRSQFHKLLGNVFQILEESSQAYR